LEDFMKTSSIRTLIIATICLFSGAGIALADSPSGTSRTGGGTPSPDAVPQDKQTDLTGGKKGVPDDYATTPVRQGSLIEVTDSKWVNKDVTNKQGETLGKITKILKDQKTQKVEYALLEIAGTQDVRPLPWARFNEQGDRVTLNEQKEALLPSVNREDTQDISPDLAIFMNEIEQKRAERKPQAAPDPRGALPSPAPGIEGEGKKKYADQ
jgi:hypothetical protein